MLELGQMIGLLSFSFLIPMMAAMGWHCGRIWAALLFGATKTTTDINVRGELNR